MKCVSGPLSTFARLDEEIQVEWKVEVMAAMEMNTPNVGIYHGGNAIHAINNLVNLKAGDCFKKTTFCGTC